MVIINSTILSGAGAILSLTSLFYPTSEKCCWSLTVILRAVDGVQQIRALLEALPAG